MDPSVIFPRLFVILLMILTGVAARKTGVLDSKGSAVLNRLTFHICLPLLVFCSIRKNLSVDVLAQAGLGVMIALSIHLLSFLVSIPYARLLNLHGTAAGVHQFSLVFSNVAFVGLPIVRAFWGEEALPVTSMFIVVFSLFNHTLGAFILSGNGKRRLKDILLTPPLIGALLGLVAALTNIPIHPELFSGLEQMGNITTPLAMFSIGCTLASMDLRRCFGDWRIYLTCLMRLLVIPAVVWAVLYHTVNDYYLWAVPTVICGMPCPSTLPILAQRYHADEEAAGKMVALSTLLAIITIPLLYLFFLTP